MNMKFEDQKEIIEAVIEENKRINDEKAEDTHEWKGRSKKAAS